MAVVELDATIAARIRESVEFQTRLLDAGHINTIARAASAIVSAFHAGGKVLLFGNGGSAADAQHMAAEFSGRYLRERSSLPAVALTDNTSSLTAIGNDYSFDYVFARQVEGLCQPNDVVIAISTSGNSRNVLEGVSAARRRGAITVGLTGESGGELAGACDICIRFPSSATPRIQEGHTLIAHILCEIAENKLAESS